MHLRGGTYKHTYTERLCISNDVIQDVTSDHMAAQDLAKPTSLQPIVATYGLAKPTPMHLIQKPHFAQHHCLCTFTAYTLTRINGSDGEAHEHYHTLTLRTYLHTHCIPAFVILAHSYTHQLSNPPVLANVNGTSPICYPKCGIDACRDVARTCRELAEPNDACLDG